jgi:hypothetical protein
MTLPHEITADAMALQVLPDGILRLVLAELDVPEPLLAALAERGIATVADLLTPTLAAGLPGAADRAALRTAIGRAVDRGLPRHSTLAFDPGDWPSVQGCLLIPLDDDQRGLLRALLGLDEPAITMERHARRVGLDLRVVEAIAERTRARLHARSRELVTRLHQELEREFTRCGGVCDARQIATGALLQTMAAANDGGFPLRLAEFCFPHECHRRGRLLLAISRRALHRLLEQMRAVLLRHRLPLPLDRLAEALGSDRKALPAALLEHLVRSELQLAIAATDHGNVVVPGATPTARLAELLEEAGKPLPFEELVFAYRERHRRATPSRIEQHLRADPTFVLVGPTTFALRRWCCDELDEIAALADRAARHVCAEGDKQDVLGWLVAQGCTERAAWLALDRLRRDRRVRLLGRGEACPATERRSQVLQQLLVDFRRACGDVVESMFVGNQPTARRRLVQRLLGDNRMFVRPEHDRVDTLTNYPFNENRLRRLRRLVRRVVEEGAGCATIETLVAAVNATDLGGSWLSPLLLTEVLRRHGWLDVLPGGFVALGERALGAHLLRLARQELRNVRGLVTVDEIVRRRPELAEFRNCIAELLGTDPLVQSPDGRRFALV